MSKLTRKRLRQLLEYDPATGVFRRKISVRGRGCRAGDIAGSPHPAGYTTITVDMKRYLAHRLTWFYMTGRWPKNQVDHRDRDRRNDRWENLREATGTQNNANAKRHRTNKSGLKGVCWHKQRGKWRATISASGVQRHLGLFDDKSAAHVAYMEAAQKSFGAFARAA